jgi:hypothetical protein
MLALQAVDAIAAPDALREVQIGLVALAVGLCLVFGGDLEGESFGLWKLRAAIEADARDANDGELNRQHVAFLAVRIIPRRAIHGADGALGECCGIEARGGFCVAPVPETDGIFCSWAGPGGLTRRHVPAFQAFCMPIVGNSVIGSSLERSRRIRHDHDHHDNCL